MSLGCYAVFNLALTATPLASGAAFSLQENTQKEILRFLVLMPIHMYMLVMVYQILEKVMLALDQKILHMDHL